MTERQTIILERLKVAGTATTAELVQWLDCDRREAALILGIMLKCNQLFRVGWTAQKGVENGIALWSLNPPGGTRSAFERDLSRAAQDKP